MTRTASATGPQPIPARRGTLWLPVAAVVALGSVLLVTVFVVRGALLDAAELAARRDADAFARLARSVARRARQDLDAADLEALIEDHEEAGLHYVAVLRSHHEPPISAGTALLPERWRPGVYEVEDRIRAVQPLMRGPRRRRFPDAFLAVEVVPTSAEGLRSQSTLVVAIGAASGAALVLLAVLFARLLRQRERLLHEQQAQAQLATLGEMSAVLAHEIRNPLASLKGHGQLLVELLAGGPHAARAERVVTDAVRLQDLTTDLLQFVKSGGLQRHSVAPRDVVASAVDALNGSGRVRLDASNAPATWSLDPDRVHQALVNILENAVEATESDVDVVVRLARSGLVVTVRDHGPGIPAADLERIFEPFHSTRTNGTGLGLAVARRVAELHGGTLVAANVDAGGALFTLTIPRGGTV